MGRLIDTNDLHNKVMLNKSDWGIFATQIDNLIESIVMQAPTVEAISKSEYEARLKADMVAMLTEIQLEIEEYVREFGGSYSRGYNTALLTVEQNIIQQKINELMAD